MSRNCSSTLTRTNLEVRTSNRRFPLLEGALHDHSEVNEFLIERAANINAHTRFGWTVLHHACSNGQVGLVELLLAHQANVEAICTGLRSDSDGHGVTDQRPLHCVVKKSDIPEDWRLKVVEVLVSRGEANVGARDSRGATSIHAAVDKGWQAGLMILLKRATPADLAITDKSGRTALDIAIDRGDGDLIDAIKAAQYEVEFVKPLTSDMRNASLDPA